MNIREQLSNKIRKVSTRKLVSIFNCACSDKASPIAFRRHSAALLVELVGAELRKRGEKDVWV